MNESVKRWLRLPLPGWLQIAIILACGGAAYANSLHGPFLFDDTVVITGEPAITDFALQLTDSRLVTDFTFALNYLLHGERTFGYHLVNLLLHLATALLVYAFVRLLFRTPQLHDSRLADRADAIALLTATLFVVHPIQTQAVAYIAQRYAVMAALFYLAACCCYLLFRLSLGSKVNKLGLYGAFLLCLVLGLLSKQNAITAPAMALVLELLLFRANLKKRLLYFSPFVVALLAGSAIFLLSNVTLQSMAAHMRLDTLMSRHDYLLTQMRVIVTYLRLLIVPVGQNLDYDYPIYTSFGNPAVLFSTALHVGLITLAAFLARRAKKGQKDLALPALAIIWFYLTLCVESSVIPIVDVIYEHRLYLPSIGFFLLAAGIFYALPLQGRQMTVRAAVALSLVATLAVATVARNRVWQSAEALWSDTAEKSPHKPRPLNNLGLVHFNAGDYNLALRYYLQAIASNPNYIKAYFNAGEACQQLGRYQEALGYYRVFISAWPDYPESYKKVSEVYSVLGETENALYYLKIYNRMQTKTLATRYR